MTHVAGALQPTFTRQESSKSFSEKTMVRIGTGSVPSSNGQMIKFRTPTGVLFSSLFFFLLTHIYH